MGKNALLAVHNDSLREILVMTLEGEGYEVVQASTREDLMEKSKSRDYNQYIMDVNFCNPGSTDFSPSRDLYALVSARVKRQEAKFTAFSGEEKTVDAAIKEGIPAISNTKLNLAKLLE